METVIQNLLSMARGRQQVEETVPTSLETVAREAWRQTDTAEAFLHVPEDAGTIVADDDRLQAVFENLFRNAVEHSGDDVDVRVGLLNDRFYVADSGPGIPPAD
jgi:signal transduction histidine kinase